MESVLPALITQAGEVRADLATSPRQAHIWILPVTLPSPDYTEIWPLLSSGEQRRSARFKQPADHHRFVATRGALRKLLGVYLECAPQAIEFETGCFGKPILGEFPRQADYAFNVSHSGDWALIGISRNLIGVDIEEIRPAPDLNAMLDIVCSSSERTEMYRCHPAERHARFYKLWTIKEAVSKLQGVGLSRSLARLQVELDPHDIRVRNDKNKLLPYTIRLLEGVPRYAGAVAVESSNAEIRFMQPVAPDNRPL